MFRLAVMCCAPAALVLADEVLLVGLYKDTGTSVLSFVFNGSDCISNPTPSDIGAAPSWIIPAHGTPMISSDDQWTTSLLSVSETKGTVASLSLHCDGTIAQTSCVSSNGAGPVFLATDPTNTYVLSANYGAGSVSVIPLSWNGCAATLRAASQTVEFGSNAHAHSAYFAWNASVFVPTLGLDKVQQLDFRHGKLFQAHEPLPVPAQQGPRHMAFHPFLPLVVLTNEGSATAPVTIELLRYNTETTELGTIATYDAAGPYSAPDLYPAEVLFTKSGHFVLVSVRDATDQERDGVAVFKFEENGPSLRPVGYTRVGHYPRSMVLADNGLLIVGNQKGNSLSFLQLNFATGNLTKTRDDLPIGGSVAFVGIFKLAQGCNGFYV